MSKEQGSESAVSGSQFIKKEEEMAEEKEAPKRVSRREFVKGAAVGGAGVAAAGALASCAPAGAPSPEVIKETVEVPVEVIKEVEVKPWLPEKWDYEADVVVVGFGYAGCAAAIDAADLGASVIVLEKAPREYWGGNTGAKSTGIGGSNKIGRTVESYIEYLRSMAWGTVPDEDLLRDHVLAVFELPAWYEKLGATIGWLSIGPVHPLLPGAEDWGGTDTEPNQFEVHPPDESKQSIHEWMASLVLDRGVNVMCNTPATELIQGVGKEVLGVKALEGVTFTKDFHQEPGGKEIYVKARKGVILACGGYQNNREMLHNFAIHPHSAFVTFYGSPFNTGDGVLMAEAAGAKLWHMNFKMCHAWSCAAAARELGVGRTIKGYAKNIAPNPGIIVNRDGKRFFNEFFEAGKTMATKKWDEFEHKHLPTDDYEYSDYRHNPMYWVFDDTTMKAGPLDLGGGQWITTKKVWEWSEDNQTELAKGWFIKADTIEELGEKIDIKDFFGRVVGMDAAGLVETVSKYNQYCAAGKDDDFGRRAVSLLPLSTPPFYAMEVCDCQTCTGGGPEHNRYSQTLDGLGRPLSRLYSTGELGAAFGGFIYNGGGCIPEAASTGRIAAKHAVALEPWD